jgi:hypothetical protein
MGPGKFEETAAGQGSFEGDEKRKTMDTQGRNESGGRDRI